MPAFPILRPLRRRLPFAAALLALLLAACAAPQPPGAGAPEPAAPDAPAAPAGPPPPSEPVADPDDGADGGASAPGVPELRTACSVDSDCVVKDVGNCCGAYPACVHRDSPADPQAVMAQCQRSGMASVCGFREIQACACVQNRCEAADASTPVER